MDDKQFKQLYYWTRTAGVGTIAITALLCLFAVGACPVRAGEPAKQDKAKRIAQLTTEIPAQKKYADEYEANTKSPIATRDDIARWTKLVATVRARVTEQELELAYLKGQTTKASVEAEVKAAKDALKAAEEAKKPTEKEKAALDVAQKRLALIEKWEGEY